MEFRVVRLKLAWDLSAEAGGGSDGIECTYAVPNDGRDVMDMTMEELRAWPSVSALAILDRIVTEHSAPPRYRR